MSNDEAPVSGTEAEDVLPPRNRQRIEDEHIWAQQDAEYQALDIEIQILTRQRDEILAFLDGDQRQRFAAGDAKIARRREERDQAYRDKTIEVRDSAEVEYWVKRLGEDAREEITSPFAVAVNDSKRLKSELEEDINEARRVIVEPIDIQFKDFCYGNEKTSGELLASIHAFSLLVEKNETALSYIFNNPDPRESHWGLHSISGLFQQVINLCEDRPHQARTQKQEAELRSAYRVIQHKLLGFFEKNEMAFDDNLERAGKTKNAFGDPNHEILIDMVLYGTSSQKELARRLFKNYEDAYAQVAQRCLEEPEISYTDDRQSRRYLASLLAFGSEPTIQKFQNELQRRISGDDPQPDLKRIDPLHALDYFADIAVRYDPEQTKKLVAIIEPFLTEQGLDANECVKAWVRSCWNHSDEGYEPKIAVNLHRIKQIAAQDATAAKTLHSDFNILNFGRYEAVTLLAQVRERDTTILPYVTLFAARDDHSGVFYHDGEVLEKFRKSMEGRANLRIVEIGSLGNVARLLITLDRKYNDPALGSSARKIGGGIWMGHGSKDSLAIGPNDEINIADLQRERTKRGMSFFEDDAPHVIVACHAGEEGGLRDHAQHDLGISAIGPDDATRLIDLEAVIEEGRIKAMNPTFRNASAITDRLKSW